MKTLTLSEIQEVSGGSIATSGLICGGSLILLGATDGLAAAFGAAAVAMGSCVDFLDQIDP